MDWMEASETRVSDVWIMDIGVNVEIARGLIVPATVPPSYTLLVFIIHIVLLYFRLFKWKWAASSAIRKDRCA
jgi:hypothetical protein